MSKYKVGDIFIHTNTGQTIEIMNPTTRYSGYWVQFEKNTEMSWWSSDTIERHLEAGTWKLPHGYQTPLWKVLNGE